MTDTLTPLDATFLELEQLDDVAHMHIGAASIFRARADGSIPTLAELREHLEDRLAALPRYRCRLSEPATGGLTWPEWQPDDQFDIANHVRHASLPAPGGDDELCEWLGDYWSHRLDRHQPLWETVLLDGLEGGRWALVSKTHHAMVDGVGSVDAGALVLDSTPEGDEHDPDARDTGQTSEPASSAHNGQSRLDRLAKLLRWAPEQVLHAARVGTDVAIHPGKAVDMLDRSRATLDLLLHDELIAAPHSSLNCEIGATRSFAVVRVPLADAKRVKTQLGGTVNDFVLAAVTGGLRALLDQRGEAPPSQGLRAMVPMNVRQASDRLALGNRVSSLFVHLPVAADSPAQRYDAVVAEAEQLKSGNQALGTSSMMSLAGIAPPVLHARSPAASTQRGCST